MRPSFRIFYDDWSTFDGDPCDAPTEGVIAIVQRDDAVGDPYAVGRTIVFDKDFYWWVGTWVGGDLYGLFDYLRNHRGARCVAFGRWTDRANYKAILLRAQNDLDFPVKTALQAGEDKLRDIR